MQELASVLGIDWLVVYLFRRYIIFFAKSASYTVDQLTLAEVHAGKMISDLNGSLGSRQLLNVANERTCIMRKFRETFSGEQIPRIMYSCFEKGCPGLS